MIEQPITRRALLQSTAAAGALAVSPAAPTPGSQSQRLLTGWEHYRGTLGSVWEVWRGKAASDNVAWDKITMPHCFNAYDAVDPDHPYYQGLGWYRASVAVANPFPNGRTLLHFEGAGQKSKVWVGLDEVGQHVGGYDEWVVDITAAARKNLTRADAKGKVQIAVCCDNSRDFEMIPSNLSDFNLYGGLYRYVNLVYVPALSIERVHIDSTLSADGKAAATVRARLYNPAGVKDAPELTARVTDAAGNVVYTGALDRKFDIPAPKLWSPDTPHLYTATVTLKSSAGEMEVSERFGLRRYEFVEHGPFKLNGQRVLIQGTQRHEDHAGLAAGMPEDLIRKEMRMVKEMGCNFIRLGHYQQSRIVLECCDELGLMVWEEVPWCRGGVGGEKYRKQGRDMMTALIDQHRNHPSVIVWGLGNENDWPGDFTTFDEKGVIAYMSELNDLAHKLDPARLTALRRCEFAKHVPDVYSPSIWAGWYRGRYTEYKAETEKEIASTKRFLHMEWGGDSHARRHSEDPDKGLAQIAMGQGADERGLDYQLTGGQARASKDGDWSESYICNLFDWHLKEQESMPNLSGTAMWVFKDFSTPLRPENPVPRMNQKGVLERDLTPKEGYYVFQSYWAKKPMAHIYGHTWPIRWGKAGEQKLVKVYSNCPQAELFLNGESLGTKQRKGQDFPAAGLRWLAKFRVGENTLRVVAKQGGVTVEDEIKFLYETRTWTKPAKLGLREVSRSGTRITVEARLFDSAGVPCLDARNAVAFSLAGDGKLLDNLGTSSGSRKVEMYNGAAMITVERTAGRSVVSVTSAGVPAAFLDLA